MSIRLADKQFEFNLWANEQLIALCATLDEAQLEIEVEGVFGRIQPTIAHLVRAEGAYLGILNGERPWVPEPDWDNMPIPELLEKAKLSGQMLLDIAGNTEPGAEITVPWHGENRTFVGWVVLLQAHYHGIEHRTQLKILLTQLGVEHPELAGWDFWDQG